MADLTHEERELLARAAVRILSNWQVEDEDARRILGCVEKEVYAAWHAGAFRDLPASAALPCTILVGIHMDLRIMFSEPARGYDWMKRANDVFDGATPLETIAIGDIRAMLRVRAYLDAQRHPW